MWASHLDKNLIEPLQWPMKMNFDPTRSRSYVLSVIFSAPSFNETHSDRTHFRKLIYCLEAMIDRLRKQLRELLIVKDFQGAPRRYLANSARMKAVMMIAVSRLNEDRRVREAFSVDLTTDIIQMNALSDVTSSVFDCAIAIDVAQLTQAESIRICRRVCEAINDNRCGITVKDFTDTAVEFVISDASPIGRFLVAESVID